jgi:hypothetical protein
MVREDYVELINMDFLALNQEKSTTMVGKQEI